MYTCRRISHRTHHQNHGHIEQDESWHPVSSFLLYITEKTHLTCTTTVLEYVSYYYLATGPTIFEMQAQYNSVALDVLVPSDELAKGKEKKEPNILTAYMNYMMVVRE
uniref:Uncharacterized protein n=1 Tax=Arundo donax TaxID=35708 RepID=A0A0A9D4V3_ARUDO